MIKGRNLILVTLIITFNTLIPVKLSDTPIRDIESKGLSHHSFVIPTLVTEIIIRAYSFITSYIDV